MKADLGNRLHWNNSSNVLCNYMREQEYLNLVLKNQAIIPRYVMEPVEYLNLGEIKTICFPMTCFCDIPFSRVSTHMSRYGQYGIGLDKEAALNKHRIQPIHYMGHSSPLTDDFREVFTSFYSSDTELGDSAEILLDYVLSTLVYMKPIWGQEKNKNGDLENYVYQDECEWRYIPSDNFPPELGPLILPQSNTSESARNVYTEALSKHEECWLKFDWDDVKYIMVPDEAAVKATIATIESLPLNEDAKHFLHSRIEISRRFSDNM